MSQTSMATLTINLIENLSKPPLNFNSYVWTGHSLPMFPDHGHIGHLWVNILPPVIPSYAVWFLITSGHIRLNHAFIPLLELSSRKIADVTPCDKGSMALSQIYAAVLWSLSKLITKIIGWLGFHEYAVNAYDVMLTNISNWMPYRKYCHFYIFCLLIHPFFV